MPAYDIFKKPLVLDIIAVICGILLTLSFAPFGIFPLAIISPAILLAIWMQSTTKRAFIRGWLFGLGLFGSGVYWVFISIHTYGNTSAPLAFLFTAGFVALLALFPALNGYLLNKYFPHATTPKAIFAFPAIWVLLEWVRSWVFSGFPWLFLGYSQINSPLKGYAPLLSVYGVSLFVLFSAALLYKAVEFVRSQLYKEMYFNLFFLFLFWAIGSVLSFIHWTKPESALTKISLVQGNIPQELKWSADQILPTLDRYEKMTAKHWDSRIIIWPESAIPLPLQDVTTFIDAMDQTAKKHHAALITGIPITAPQTDSFYNALVTIGDGHGEYTKQRLVPFGEYIPLKNIFQRLFDILQIPMSDFIPGPHAVEPFEIGNIKMATYICYEIAFPEQVLFKDSTIGMLLTVSNDAWFGHSIAQAQHLEMGQMRAAELGRPVIFVSNNGLTAFIAPTGKVQSVAPAFESYILTDSIQSYVGRTPWQRFGMDPVLIILIVLLVLARRENRLHDIS